MTSFFFCGGEEDLRRPRISVATGRWRECFRCYSDFPVFVLATAYGSRLGYGDNLIMSGSYFHVSSCLRHCVWFARYWEVLERFQEFSFDFSCMQKKALARLASGP
jgi:hypothetical protein